jgi:hypothetical protein
LASYGYGYGYGYGGYSQPASTETTNAIDAGLLGGVDFAINESFSVGAGADYNFNVLNITNFNNEWLPPGAQPLEKISYWTLKLTAKFTF